MGDIRSLAWLFPVLFMLHDFEEIILLKGWLYRNRDGLIKRFPKAAERLLSHFDGISTAAFSLGVAEEFVLVCTICVVSLLTSWYALWFGMMIAFLIHLFVHILQTIAMKQYVPSFATSILFLPAGYCVVLFAFRQSPVPLGTLVLYALIAVAMMVLNLVAVHKWMGSFERLFNHDN